MYRCVRPHDTEFESYRRHPTHSGSAGPGYMQFAVCIMQWYVSFCGH